MIVTNSKGERDPSKSYHLSVFYLASYSDIIIIQNSKAKWLTLTFLSESRSVSGPSDSPNDSKNGSSKCETGPEERGPSTS